MGSTGQTIGGIAGAVIGAYLGQGVGGAYVGFSLGMMIGSAIDPPRGQRMAPDYSRSDAYYNSVGRNTPVPIVYGVNRVGGNLIWLAPKGTRIVGTDSKKDGGSGGGGGGGSKKGGDTDQRAVIDIDWAVALSEGEIAVVSDVFMGDEVAEISDGMDYTAYLGTQTQSADSRVVNDLGPLAPAFRNLAYVALSAELESPSLPTVNAELQGIGGTPVQRNQQSYPLGFNAFAGDAVEMGDGSLLALTHNGEQIFRSIDRGESWYDPAGIQLPSGYIVQSALGVHPGVPERAYAAIYTYVYGNVRVYRSDDYGATWTNTSQPMVEAFDADAVCGVAGRPDEVLCFSGTYPGFNPTIWKSTDGALTFAPVAQLPNMGWFTQVLGTCQPEAGGLYAHAGGWSRAMRGFSGDGGNSWEWTECDVGPISNGCVAFRDYIIMGGNTSSGAACMVSKGGEDWVTYPIANVSIGGFKCNSYGLLVAVSSGRAYYSTTLGATWQNMRAYTLAHPVLIPWGGPQCMWLTTDQVCVGGGSPAYVTCIDFTVPTSCGNPALIVRDLLTNRRYGMGLDDTYRIDDDSFVTASNYCIAQVPSRLSSGHLEQRFCLDYVVDQQIPVVDHLRDMLATFGGYLCWSQGTVKLKIDMPSSCCQSFGMAQIVADSFQWKKRSYRDRPNVVHVDYVEPGNTVRYPNNQPQDNSVAQYFIQTEEQVSAGVSVNKNYKTYKHDFVEASDPWDIETTRERRERTINLVGIKRRSQAQRMAEYYLAKSIHCQHTCLFRVGVNALKAEVGDVIAVTHDIPGWAGKLFRIVEIQETENDELTLGCVEYNEAVFRAVAGLPPGQDEIVNDMTPRLLAAPFHVARLTAYERPYENAVEINYTRIATNDLFGGVYLYKRVGEDGAWIRQAAKLSLAPTAYLTSHLQTITLVQS